MNEAFIKVLASDNPSRYNELKSVRARLLDANKKKYKAAKEKIEVDFNGSYMLCRALDTSPGSVEREWAESILADLLASQGIATAPAPTA